MLIKFPLELISDDVNKGDVLTFQVEGEKLLFNGTPVAEKGNTMHQPEYQGIVMNMDPFKVTVSVARFADLHRHSDCSLLDGISKISDIAKYSVPQGALTDHGNMYGFLEHYKAMRNQGKKPIIGFEAYVENMDGDLKNDHLILLAKNEIGYKNLLKLCSDAFQNMARNHPHVRISELKKHSDGVIATSACISGTIAKLIRANEMEKAEYMLKVYQDIFGDDFYLEVQRHGIDDEKKVEQVYKQWQEEKGIKVIATTDSHFTLKDDAAVHEIALCLQTGKLLSEPHYRFDGSGYHIHSSEEMELKFGDWPEVLENTLELASKCNVELKLGDVNLPKYPIPVPFKDPTAYFEHLCKEGYENRFGGKPEHDDPVYLNRYDYEMQMIKKMGFVSYFIIVWDFINFARSKNIYVGPGRGSAAGSLLAYCIGITDLDPIKLNLFFERFLNPERVSWPDIDTDFEHNHRAEVIEYIKQKYGENNVCHIITFGTMAARMAVKDIGRVLGYPAGFCGSIAKLIPAEPKMTIQKALDESPELKEKYENNTDVKTIIDFAKKIEGCKRHASQHACFDADTMITTDAGIKRIVDVKVGDKVLTHMGRYKEVVDTIVTKTNTVYTVTCYGSKPIVVTGNHPLLVRHQTSVSQKIDGKKTKARTLGEAHWVPVKDLQNNDYIGIPINNESVIPSIGNLPTSNDAFWWIIGRYIGDGWTEIYHRKNICPNHTERRIIICCEKKATTVNRIVDKLSRCGISCRVENSRTTKKIFLSPDKELFDYLQTFGRYATGKHLNRDVLNLPVDLAKAFLEGYLSADGYYRKENKTYYLKTVSEELAMGVSLLVNKVYHVAVGYTSRNPQIDVIEGRQVHSKRQYGMTFIVEDRSRKKYFFDQNCLWVRLKSVKSRAVDQANMYNLTVLDDSSYQANGFSAHNCGLVIAPSTVSDYLPTAMLKDDETGEVDITSQVIMTEVEELSLLKMDMLGLKNMSVIHECDDGITRITGKKSDYHNIPMNDRNVLKFLAEGNTGGVFQLESPGMTRVVTRMLADIDQLPDEELHQGFERMIAAVALYRPGPMAYIDDYIDNMRNPEKTYYDHPMLEPILKPTYGIIVFQEQVMQIVQKMAGYTLGRADLVRKSMGKKKQKIMDQEKQVFIYGNKEAFEAGKDENFAPGCIANGISEEIAIKVWDKMADFAKYAFNRSHAACYAYIAMITAWLSYYYPAEFYAAMLNAFIENSDKVKTYLSQVDHREIKVLPPDVNKSEAKFVVEDKAIRFGLRGIKGMNKTAISIEKEREAGGPFTSFQNFFDRMKKTETPIEKKNFEALLFSGALDCFGFTKASIFQAFPQFAASAADDRKLIQGQMSLFSGDYGEEYEKYGVIEIPYVQEFPKRELMRNENEMLGFYLSEHPVDQFESVMPQKFPFQRIDTMVVGENPRYGQVSTIGMIRNLRKIFTRNEELMYVFVLENKHESISCVLFPRDVQRNESALVDGHVALVSGTFQNDDRGRQIIVKSMVPEALIMDELVGKEDSIFIPVACKPEQEKILNTVRQFHPRVGYQSMPVYMVANGKLYPKTGPLHIKRSVYSVDHILTVFPKAKIGKSNPFNA